jgi:molybdopterin converting factor small subunit
MMWQKTSGRLSRCPDLFFLDDIMCKYIVRIFGLPQGITDQREIEVELAEGSGMKDVIVELRKKIPELEGPVFREGEDRLAKTYKFNLNGTFYFDGMDFKLKNGDSLALLSPISGG